MRLALFIYFMCITPLIFSQKNIIGINVGFYDYSNPWLETRYRGSLITGNQPSPELLVSYQTFNHKKNYELQIGYSNRVKTGLSMLQSSTTLFNQHFITSKLIIQYHRVVLTPNKVYVVFGLGGFFNYLIQEDEYMAVNKVNGFGKGEFKTAGLVTESMLLIKYKKNAVYRIGFQTGAEFYSNINFANQFFMGIYTSGGFSF